MRSDRDLFWPTV